MDDPHLTDLQRRLLAALPSWTDDEDAYIAEEGGPEVSERSHTAEEVHANLHEAGHPFLAIAGPMSVADLTERLRDLQRLGYAEYVEDRPIAGIRHVNAWRMTQEGLEALTYVSPASLQPSSEPATPADVELQPATAGSGAVAQ